MSFCMHCDRADCHDCTYTREGWKELEELQSTGEFIITDVVAAGSGVPICPVCRYLIYPDSVGNKWSCVQCGTVWSTEELVEALLEL